jgi:hypothetical protein
MPIRHRRADQRVAVALRIEPSTERDRLREVDVEPEDAWRRIDPDDARVEPAAEMEHGSVGMRSDRVARPAVEYFGAHREADHHVAIDPLSCRFPR